ncbi:MAG: aminotransferase class I/II-fold pyridoxal phosphate-dependent enzyme, partial [Cyanobacteria bacterium J06648_11]
AWFLVNGSTCGIEALIMAVCNPGDRILLARNCHKSAIAGVILSGAIPAYIEPDFDAELEFAGGVSPKSVRNALDNYPDARGVLLVSPTYFGACSDVKAIAALVHARNIPLLVDEAWGAHFAFHHELPESAIASGADGVVQSTHKMLAGMTQASVLHVRGERIDCDRLSNALQLLQSTSPSYLLMMSLDVARRQMALHGTQLLGKAIALTDTTRERLNAIAGISCPGIERTGTSGSYDFDRTRLVVSVEKLGRSGFAVDEWLDEQFGVQSEMVTPSHVVFLVTIGTSQDDCDRLVDAFAALSRECETASIPNSNECSRVSRWPSLPPVLMHPREALFARQRSLSLTDAEGDICAEIVAPYPPGIPILMPGEVVTLEAIAYLQSVTRHLDGESWQTLQVVARHG